MLKIVTFLGKICILHIFKKLFKMRLFFEEKEMCEAILNMLPN